ncbi:MAG: hypothetical protein ABSF12_08440 [Bryobacteraceae bacterium]
MARFLTAICILSCMRAGQPDVRPEVLGLSAVKRKVVESLGHLPDYTCLETIARSELEGASLKSIDALRLEVTQIGEKEFFSPQGGGGFRDAVTQFVHNGMISTGQFTLMERGVFLNQATEINYAGEETRKGRRVLKYDFRIPAAGRGWTLSFGEKTVVVAAHGSFLADGATQDLVRLEKHADDIPPDLPISQAWTTIDYGRVRIGELDVLLPQTAEVVMKPQNRGILVNHAEFSQCRKYSAESSIRFGDAPESQSLTVPPNVPIVLELEQTIDAETNAEGDAISARVAADVSVRNQVVIPKGTVVRGRIRSLENSTITLEFVELVVGNRRAEFTARLEKADGAVKVAHGPALPGVGLLLTGKLPAGLRTTWRTPVPKETNR